MNIKNKMTQKTLKKLEKITGTKLTLGKLIYSIRMADEITQVEFAQQLGISKQQLCDIEHDRKSLSPKLAALYAEKLGYAPEQFVRLCLQDLMDREGIALLIEVNPKNEKQRRQRNSLLAYA